MPQIRFYTMLEMRVNDVYSVLSLKLLQPLSTDAGTFPTPLYLLQTVLSCFPIHGMLKTLVTQQVLLDS